MANYTDKSEKELQELLEELIESNETLETLLPDDDIQLEIDANNKSIKEIILSILCSFDVVPVTFKAIFNFAYDLILKVVILKILIGP